jgi:hypothetical protein
MEGFGLMQLPHSTTQADYIKQVKAIEAELKDATSDELDKEHLEKLQAKLDTLAERYQHNEEIGPARYKLYELQALVHYFNNSDEDALDFINSAIAIRGDDYPRAEKIKDMVLKKSRSGGVRGNNSESVPPLELQALIRGQRTSAIIMALISILSIYFIPWAIFYIILAIKLNPQRVPNRGLIKAAAIVTLPLCLGIIPIIIDIEFWRMNKTLKAYEAQGAGMFMSNEEWLAREPKRKKGRRVAWVILFSIIAVLILLMIAAIATGGSSGSSTSTTTAEDVASQFNSSNTLPQRVDDITTLVDVTASGNVLHYYYQIEGGDTSNLTNDALYTNVQPGVCSGDDMRQLLNEGMSVQYEYTIVETGAQYAVHIGNDDCV